jgi:galactokinase
MRAAFDWHMSDVALARTAQRAEVEFVGAPVGIMDQMASSLALEREALFLDTRSLAFERIALPPTLDLVVIDSGIAHQHASGAYRQRRQESEEAAARLGVDRLRDVGLDRLAEVERLPAVLARRARHIVTENARVLAARTALQSADLRSLGELFNASHASLRDDYEVSVPALDTLVALAQRQPQVFGARMTGGGFGGSIVAAVAAGSAATVSERVSALYADACGASPAVLLPAG